MREAGAADLWRRFRDLYTRETADSQGARSKTTAVEEAPASLPGSVRGEAARIYSRMLGAELWIASDEAVAAELYANGVTLPVLLPHEAETLAAMAENDARMLFHAVERIQRSFPGARLRRVAAVENSDA